MLMCGSYHVISQAGWNRCNLDVTLPNLLTSPDGWWTQSNHVSVVMMGLYRTQTSLAALLDGVFSETCHGII